MKFIHLTDPHFVPPGARLYGLDPRARLERAVLDINTQHADAEFVLITGDLAHRGEPEAYRALRDTLQPLRPRCELLLGNHDDRGAFRSVFPAVPVDEHGFVQRAVGTSIGRFLLLDTHEPGTHEGRYCARRRAWLERELAREPEAPCYIAMHHPPLPLGLPCMDRIGLADAPEFERVLRKSRSVRHLFFGHVHRPVHGTYDGIPFSTQRALSHQVALHFAPAEGIPGSHEPPAYAIVVAGDDGNLVIHVHDFLDRSPRFDLFDRSAEAALELG